MWLDILSLSHNSKPFVLFEMPKSDIQYVLYIYCDRQAIHPHALESPIPCCELAQSQTYYADLTSGMQCYTWDNDKKTPSLLLSSHLPFLSITTLHIDGKLHISAVWEPPHLSISQGLDCKMMWKAWGSGFWGWFPQGCKDLQMAAFKS